MRLNVTISKTSSGEGDYIQVMSDDMISVNVVLVAEEIAVRDVRGASYPEERCVNRKGRIR